MNRDANKNQVHKDISVEAYREKEEKASKNFTSTFKANENDDTDGNQLTSGGYRSLIVIMAEYANLKLNELNREILELEDSVQEKFWKQGAKTLKS